MRVPLPRPDVHRINITLYLEDTDVWGRGDNVLWSNILIIPLTSLFPPLPPSADPEPAPSLSLPPLLSLIHSLLRFLPHTPSSRLDRGTGEIIIMF